MADGKNLALRLARLNVEPELIRKAIELDSERRAEAKAKFFGEKTKEIYHDRYNKLSAHYYKDWIHIKAWNYRSSRNFSYVYILSYNVKTGEIKYDTVYAGVDEKLVKLAREFLKELLGEKPRTTEPIKAEEVDAKYSKKQYPRKQYPRVQKLLKLLEGAEVEPEFSNEKSTSYIKGDTRIIVFYDHENEEAYALIDGEEFSLRPSEAREFYKLLQKRVL